LRPAWIVLEQRGFISEQSDDNFGHGLNADPRTDLGGGVKMAALGAAAGAAIAVGFARRRVAIGSRLTTR